jgi:amino acid permease
MVSIIFMRVNSVIQKSLYGGTTLQPLAYEGFISNRFAKLTKEGVPKNASKLNLLITLAVALI